MYSTVSPSASTGSDDDKDKTDSIKQVRTCEPWTKTASVTFSAALLIKITNRVWYELRAASSSRLDACVVVTQRNFPEQVPNSGTFELQCFECRVMDYKCKLNATKVVLEHDPWLSFVNQHWPCVNGLLQASVNCTALNQSGGLKMSIECGKGSFQSRPMINFCQTTLKKRELRETEWRHCRGIALPRFRE